MRRGLATVDGPYDGMPRHMHNSVGEWVRYRFGWSNPGGMYKDFMAQGASGLRIPVTRTHATGGISDQIFAAIESNGDLYLDCFDLMLHLGKGRTAGDLDAILQTGGSVWRVNETKTGLERRVDDEITAAFKHALSPGDAAAAELKDAWASIFGRSPNPLDAWDHAIKAVEEITIPLVIPKKDKANLGGVAGDLKSNPTL